MVITIKLFVFLIIMGFLFVIGWGCFYYFKTIFFRKNIKKGDTCKFYIGDEKHFGKVSRCYGIKNNQIEIEFLDINGTYEKRLFLKSNLYPAW